MTCSLILSPLYWFTGCRYRSRSNFEMYTILPPRLKQVVLGIYHIPISSWALLIIGICVHVLEARASFVSFLAHFIFFVSRFHSPSLVDEESVSASCRQSYQIIGTY